MMSAQAAGIGIFKAVAVAIVLQPGLGEGDICVNLHYWFKRWGGAVVFIVEGI